MYLYVYMNVFIYTYKCIYMYICMCLYVYMYAFICICVSAYGPLIGFIQYRVFPFTKCNRVLSVHSYHIWTDMTSPAFKGCEISLATDGSEECDIHNLKLGKVAAEAAPETHGLPPI